MKISVQHCIELFTEEKARIPFAIVNV